MDNTQRDSLRDLQDKVIAKLAKMGYTDDTEKIIDNITLWHIKTLLHPNYEATFREFINEA